MTVWRGRENEFVAMLMPLEWKKSELSIQLASLWVGSLDWTEIQLEIKSGIFKWRKGQGGEAHKEEERKTDCVF